MVEGQVGHLPLGWKVRSWLELVHSPQASNILRFRLYFEFPCPPNHFFSSIHLSPGVQFKDGWGWTSHYPVRVLSSYIYMLLPLKM